jgi:hypothetical protein
MVNQLEEIKKHPINQFRQRLIGTFCDTLSKKINVDEGFYNSFYDQLENFDNDYSELIRKIQYSSDEDISEDDVKGLNSPIVQLAFATKILQLYQSNQQSSIQSTNTFKQILDSSKIKKELGHLVRDIETYPNVDENCTISFSYPGSGYWFNPENKHINLDLFYTLASGIENAHVVALHEIAHAEITTKFTPEMQRLREEQSQLLAQGNLGAEQQEELRRIVTEYNKRHVFFNEVEDLRVGSFVKELNSLEGAFDYIHAFNTVGVNAGAYSDVPIDSDAYQNNLTKNIRYIDAAVHNGLFELSAEQFRALGADPDKIISKTGVGFDGLVEILEGENGIINLLPSTYSRLDKNYYKQQIEETTNQAMEQVDFLWDEFVDGNVDLNPQNQPDQPNKPDQPDAQQPPQPTESEDKKPEEQSDDKSENGEPNEIPEGEGGENPENGEPNERPEGEDGENPESGEPNESPEGQSGENQPFDPNQPLPENPQEEKAQKHEDYDTLPEDGKPLKDIKEEAEVVENQENSDWEEPTENESSDDQRLKNVLEDLEKFKDHGSGENSELIEGDLNHYQEIVKEQMPLIRKVEKIFKKMQERVAHSIQNNRGNYSLVPDGGDVDSLNYDKYIQRKIKQSKRK